MVYSIIFNLIMGIKSKITVLKNVKSKILEKLKILMENYFTQCKLNITCSCIFTHCKFRRANNYSFPEGVLLNNFQAMSLQK